MNPCVSNIQPANFKCRQQPIMDRTLLITFYVHLEKSYNEISAALSKEERTCITADFHYFP